MTKQAEKSQIEKFKETAKQVETDNSAENFDRALRRLARLEKSETKPQSARPRGK